ncbi:hypothetical protein C1645_834476 [Glomus cerebriforme]|uniref:Uncharacterized protein n=1 Tax=Glomus cerebriforme TaxID=658196 RepID=A0A397SE57_9GLOM|nr:hypothetical protein C1645_834476 [Glomus cerebriforme]
MSNLQSSEEEKINKPFKFAVKGNSEHISKALGWYMNVTITLKDEKDKPIVTIIRNYICIDNAKNQIHIKDHGKIYTILTFSKTSEINNPPKKKQD